MTPGPNGGMTYESILQLSDATSAPLLDATDEPDQRDGRCYVYEPSLKIAVEVALVTGRPLLLRGEPGSGKSSFAPFVARNLGARFYEHVVTARTQAQDLLYGYDVVRRLSDASAGGGQTLNDFDYVVPGVLWWAWNPRLAERRGAGVSDRSPRLPARDPFEFINADRGPERAVVLIDEIDKADPDLPNNLLVALGSFHFWVEEVGRKVSAKDSKFFASDLVRTLVIVTTNDDRSLSDAFLRRCVVYELPPPSAATLVAIARRHFDGAPQPLGAQTIALFEALSLRLLEHRAAAAAHGRRPPSTAEYLDAVRACLKLGIDVDHPLWVDVERCVLLKEANSNESHGSGMDR